MSAIELQPSPDYKTVAHSSNTRRAYASDLKHYSQAGYRLPANPEELTDYLKHSGFQYNPRTIKRRLVALRAWHIQHNHPDPTTDNQVRQTMQGIARTHGTPKKKAAALRLKDLEHMLLYLDKNPSLIHSRDHALILLGFFGAFRRSELVNLTWQDIEFVTEGMIINVRHSKTDQEQEGMLCAIPFGNKKLCPVRSLITWRSLSGVISGPVFRRISKSGRVLMQPLSAHYVNLRLRVVAKAAGLVYADEVTAHSLRRGFATESSRLGASMPAIKRHGRWRSAKTVVEYIEAGRQFADSAVKVMFAGGES